MDVVPTIVAVDMNVLACFCETSGERKEKVVHLLSRIDKAKGRVIIPTPAIAEFLVYADQAGLSVLDSLQGSASAYVASFDLAAAYENSLIDAAAIGRGDKRDGSALPWQKIKVDRQVVAIAKTHGAKLIVSDDDGLCAVATRVGIRSVKIDDLPLPDGSRQVSLPIDGGLKVRSSDA